MANQHYNKCPANNSRRQIYLLRLIHILGKEHFRKLVNVEDFVLGHFLSMDHQNML